MQGPGKQEVGVRQLGKLVKILAISSGYTETQVVYVHHNKLIVVSDNETCNIFARLISKNWM